MDCFNETSLLAKCCTRHILSTRTNQITNKISDFSILFLKLQREEELDVKDVTLIIVTAVEAMKWLTANTTIEVVSKTSNSSSSKESKRKNKKSKRND